jgi:ATP-dependent Clp protease ATP-binding subunit ClpA
MDIASFSSDSRAVIKLAREIATEFRHREIEVEHLLLAAVRHEGTEVESILNQMDKSPSMVGSITELYLKDQRKAPHAVDNVASSPSVQSVLSRAQQEKGKLYDTLVEPEHIFLAIFDPQTPLADYVSAKLQIAKEDIYRAIAESKSVEQITSGPAQSEQDGGETKSSRRVSGALRYCIDMTNLATAGEYDPMIGRDSELRQSIQILLRRRKNSPVLVGGAGVGKSAIVEGLAQAIVSDQVPASLRGARLMELDLGAMVAGAKYKGEFEERLKALIGEIVKSSGQIILFIDEIHTIAPGAGGGGIDAGNLLKPALARGQLRLIGATTEEEFTKHLERDKALLRRFEKIKVEAPPVEEAIAIISGVASRYEDHHKIKVLPEAIRAAARYSKRYLSDRNLPDIALDVMDEAASEFSVKKEYAIRLLPLVESQMAELDKVIVDGHSVLADTDECDDPVLLQYREFDRNTRRLNEYWGHKLQGELQSVELPKSGSLRPRFDLQRKLCTALKGVVETLEPRIDASDIAALIARRTGIPIAKMMTAEKDRLLNMESYLSSKIVGQDKAIEGVANAIRKARAGLKPANRPVGSFLFLGPTGTGKTYLSKLLAEFLFDDKNAMVRLDMSEFMEKHSVAKMIGAPPGYVGYEEGGVLTESVRRRPFSIVLFDEVEKAHPDVFNVLLQLLDDGRLTDGQNRTVDFSNCIVALTSNYAADMILDADREGREVDMDQVRNFLFTKFRPEFLNRLNDIIIYHSFSQEQAQTIARLEFEQLSVLLKDQDIEAELSAAALAKLARDGYSFELGARPIQRIIERDIINRLSVDIITGTLAPGDRVSVDVKDDAYIIGKQETTGA